MAKKRAKVVNTFIQAAFLSIVAGLLLNCAVMLWNVGAAPAYVGSVIVGGLGLAIGWWLVIQPVRNLWRPAPTKDTLALIPARFDEDQLKTWMFALGGGVFLLASAVLVAAIASGHGPKGGMTWKIGVLLGLVGVVDLLGMWGWWRVFRAAMSRRLFGRTHMSIHSGRPRLDEPVDFTIGPLNSKLQVALDQSQLNVCLECWADMSAEMTHRTTDMHGRRKRVTGTSASAERVAGFDVLCTPKIVDHEVRLAEQATPPSSRRLREATTPEQSYQMLRAEFENKPEFTELWLWLVRLKVGWRSSFYLLPAEELIRGAKQELSDDE
jgi:hypothetical protein